MNAQEELTLTVNTAYSRLVQGNYLLLKPITIQTGTEKTEKTYAVSFSVDKKGKFSNVGCLSSFINIDYNFSSNHERKELDKIEYDIDGDGVKEECVLNSTFATGFGKFGFSLMVNENGKREYGNQFFRYVNDVEFVIDKNELKIKCTIGEKTEFYTVSLDKNNINLSNNNIPLESQPCY